MLAIDGISSVPRASQGKVVSYKQNQSVKIHRQSSCDAVSFSGAYTNPIPRNCYKASEAVTELIKKLHDNVFEPAETGIIRAYEQANDAAQEMLKPRGFQPESGWFKYKRGADIIKGEFLPVKNVKGEEISIKILDIDNTFAIQVKDEKGQTTARYIIMNEAATPNTDYSKSKFLIKVGEKNPDGTKSGIYEGKGEDSGAKAIVNKNVEEHLRLLVDELSKLNTTS